MNHKKVALQIQEQVDFLVQVTENLKMFYFTRQAWWVLKKVTLLVYVHMFYCLGYMLSLYPENFFCLFTQTENLMNCFHLNPFPPKHHMKFFRDQIELYEWLPV